MAWHRIQNDPVIFPTPWRTRNVCYPKHFRSCRPYSPYNSRYDYDTTDEEWGGEKGIAALHDPKLECNGDLGWSLDYATAWCYRHLVGNQPSVIDAIDTVRDIGDIDYQTPFRIFEYLDTALFGSKLRGMVCFRWKRQRSCSPGTTSAPGVAGIPRICIELNLALFEDDDDADIDDLLDALIHHMIHAYFLVCCGAQKKGERQDGRLMDGKHFGVILMTIRDITKQCEDEVLPMIFHASKRKDTENGAALRSLMPRMQALPGNNCALPYISIDPRGCGVGPALADGQTHCLHDNRMISYEHIKNWQVNDYSRALDLDMESKGDEVYEYTPDGTLTPVLRIKAPPSVTYAELVWEKKHVMVPREKALRFKSIEWPLKSHGRYELEVPSCDGEVFTCIYDFINKGKYPGSEDIVWDPHTQQDQLVQRRGGPGPPVWTTAGTHPETHHPGLIKHIKVFKLAEKLKFEELMGYVLNRIWEMPKTTDNPILMLHEVYDARGGQSGPIHSELHRWAREFLTRTDDPLRLRNPRAALILRHRPGHIPGVSNLDRIIRRHPAHFQDLIRRSRGFQDDVKIAQAEMITKRVLPPPLQGRGMLGGLLAMNDARHVNHLAIEEPLAGLDEFAGLAGAGGLGRLALDDAVPMDDIHGIHDYIGGDGNDFVEPVPRIPAHVPSWYEYMI